MGEFFLSSHVLTLSGQCEQCESDEPFHTWGKGRAWPLLTGKCSHYELAASGDVRFYLQALECFASSTGLLPEQIWGESDRPEMGLYWGRATGAAMPLVWAHVEYIKLLRSVWDGRVFDRPLTLNSQL